MLRGKFFKRKKGKKESALSFWRKNAMQYFFEKNIAVAFLTTIFFSKTLQGLILSGHFSEGIPLLSFFLFFLIADSREVKQEFCLL